MRNNKFNIIKNKLLIQLWILIVDNKPICISNIILKFCLWFGWVVPIKTTLLKITTKNVGTEDLLECTREWKKKRKEKERN